MVTPSSRHPRVPPDSGSRPWPCARLAKQRNMLPGFISAFWVVYYTLMIYLPIGICWILKNGLMDVFGGPINFTWQPRTLEISCHEPSLIRFNETIHERLQGWNTSMVNEEKGPRYCRFLRQKRSMLCWCYFLKPSNFNFNLESHQKVPFPAMKIRNRSELRDRGHAAHQLSDQIFQRSAKIFGSFLSPTVNSFKILGTICF